MINIDIERLREAMNAASDSIPQQVYHDLVIKVTEAMSIPDMDKLEFSMSCGVVASEIADRLPPRRFTM